LESGEFASGEFASGEFASGELVSAELLALVKRVPGESGRSKRTFAAMTSAAGVLVRGV
jgi:hypothetical protein